MAQILRDDHLDQILKTNPKKMVCVFFGNPDCQYCVKSKPFWDSLPPKYPTCVFYYAECDKCPSDARRQEIKQIPTFIFYKMGNEIKRIVGRDEKAITEYIEENKPAGAFDGAGRTLGAAPINNEDFFMKLKREKEQKMQEAQNAPQSQKNPSNAQPKKKESFEPNLAPKPAKPTSSAFSGQPRKISPVQAAPRISQAEIDQRKAELAELQFPDDLIEKALHATNYGTTDECIEYIAAIQENNQLQPNPPFNPIQNDVAPSQGPKRALSPAAEAMKEQLLQFGYNEDEIMKALGIVGPDSIDKLIDCITRIQNGEPLEAIPKGPQQMTPEEKERLANELRAKAAAKKEQEVLLQPKQAAKNELERRKEVLELMELKKQTEEKKRLLEIEQAKRDKIKEKMERDRVRAKIAAQRGQQPNQQTITKAPAASAPSTSNSTASSSGAKKATECTLKFNIPGQPDLILKFPPDTSFRQVDLKVRRERPDIAHHRIIYTNTFPVVNISSGDFDKTVTELGLMPRTMLNLDLS
ncbi:Thioredoxin family protein [Tritrichomonas foetus]|uniref:Thioredoxin family protein n=1 Tax=Tritrichomonas foetus TaxID=1144522 RepID=A0A1J4J5J7_9EUKA|nr:Thioredoxin family protein [Tritrichomonas foetus]|eukprot:OHS93945.1 Thioredoxin family protein [Tritrichomonas foetus]